MQGLLAQGIKNPAIRPSIGTMAGLSFSKKVQLFLSNFISLALGVAGIVAFFVLLSGALGWVMSGGDKEAVEKSRKRITNALIGLAIVFSTYAIFFLVEKVFGIPVTKFTIPVIK